MATNAIGIRMGKNKVREVRNDKWCGWILRMGSRKNPGYLKLSQ
jgi:hypothetical protein